MPIEKERNSLNMSITKRLEVFSRKRGVELFGITPTERIEQILSALQPFYPRSSPVLNLKKWGLDWSSEYEEIKLKRPKDYVSGAKSIIVIGMHYPDTPLDRAYEPPAETVSPFVFGYTQALRELSYITIDIVRFLKDLGYEAVATLDLCGCASKTRFHFGEEVIDHTGNRYAAIAAGLGELGWHGVVITPEYGVRQRFISIVTDASLEPTSLYHGPSLCKRCFECVKVCPAKSLSKN